LAPPTYNASYHHIGLKERGTATNYGFMLVPPYQMEMQREGGGAPDFGGSMDLMGAPPSMSRWTQDEFIGGAYAWQWGRDDAMFADCTGFIPDEQGRGLLSCPPMFFKHAFDPDTKSNFVSDYPKNNFFMVGNSLYLTFGHGVLRYRIDTDAETWEEAAANSTVVFCDYEPVDGKLWQICNSSVADDRPFMRRLNTDLTDPAFDATMIGPTGTENLSAYGAAIKDKEIVVQIGRKLWAGDPPDRPDPVANGTITWRQIGRVPGRWKDSAPYQGLLYILLNDGEQSPTYHTSLVAYDGDSILPITRFPSSFYGKCMIEYAGRLFVGGTGTDINGSEQYAELYEVTGSSVRKVRTFSPETRRSLLSAGQWPRSIEDLCVHEGLLWMCQRGARMVVYDVTSDGFFGAAEILSNTDFTIQKMCGGRGRLWGYGIDEGADSNHGIYRIAQAGDTVSTWYPTFVTSDFIYEPGLKKRFGDIKIMTRYGPVSTIEYSKDSGENWSSLTVTSSNTNKVYIATANMAAVTPSECIRFRFKLDSTSPTSALTYHRELIAFTCSFAILDRGLRSWSLTINASEFIERYDAEYDETLTIDQTYTDVANQIEEWATAGTPLTFTDLDGDTRDAQIVAFRKTSPVIGPKASPETQPESHCTITLVEFPSA
jgi:hypothetical protein